MIMKGERECQEGSDCSDFRNAQGSDQGC